MNSTVQAAIRRLQLTAQPVRNGANLDRTVYRALLHDLEKKLRVAGTHRSKLKIKNLGTRDEVTLYRVIDYSGDYYVLVKGLLTAKDLESQCVGVLSTEFKDRGHINAVYVDPKYRGQGYGTVLYLGLLHENSSICSGSSFGTDACRVWRSLSKFKNVELLDLTAEEVVNFEWGPDAIPVVNGRPINKGSNVKRTFVFVLKR